jgi:colanic acid biosynthesis glycosyl transferase WcaI
MANSQRRQKTNPMRILFLNRSFWPDTDATGVLLRELTEDLATEHEVTVICGPANVGTRQRRALRFEQFGAVKVVRTWGRSLSKENLIRRTFGLAIYFLLATIAAMRERPDVVVAETDPPLLGLLGAIVKRIRGCRFIYYCQDLYPDVAKASGALKFRPLLSLFSAGNRVAYRLSDVVVVLGEDMAERLQSRGVPRERIAIIPNWIDCRKVRPDSANPPGGESGEFIVMYAGNLGLAQGLGTVLEAAHLMRDDARVKFVLVGDGARKSSLEHEARARGLDNVEFIGRLHPDAMSEVLAAGNLHLIPLLAGAAGSLVPSKVYGILAAGRPFVAMMEQGAEVARLATEFDIGFVIPPGDPAALVRTIYAGLRDPGRLAQMGRRARHLAEEKYDRHLVTRNFARLLEAVVPETLAAASIPARTTEIRRGFFRTY